MSETSVPGTGPYAPPTPGVPGPFPPPQPPAGWPGSYGFGPPPRPQGTNGFAIAGLVLGIVPVFAGVLGIAFSIVGLRQIRRTGQEGRGLARAGLILGCIWLVLFTVVLGALVLVGGHDRRDDASSVSTSDPSTDRTVDDFQVGQCLSTFPTGVIHTVDAVPCGQPHSVEAFDSFPLTGTTYPGDAAVKAKAESGCIARFAAFDGRPYDGSSLEVDFFHPTQRSWTLADDRRVTCFVESPKPVSSSLRQSHR